MTAVWCGFRTPNCSLRVSPTTPRLRSERTSVAIPIGDDVDVRRALELAGEARRGTEGISSSQKTVARILVLFIALQRYYVSGMMVGSVKG